MRPTINRFTLILAMTLLLAAQGCDERPQPLPTKPSTSTADASDVEPAPVSDAPVFTATGVPLLDAHNQPSDFKLSLRTGEGRSDYVEGDGVSFRLHANRECYLTVVSVDSDGNMTLMVPNLWKSSGRMSRGEIEAIPPTDLGFKLPIRPPHGAMRIKAIATTTPLNLRGVDAERIEDEGFVSLGNMQDIAGDTSKRLTEDDLGKLFDASEWTTAELKITTRAAPDIPAVANEKVLAKWTELAGAPAAGTKAIDPPRSIIRPRQMPKDVPAPVGLIVYYKDEQAVSKSIGGAEGTPLGLAGSMLSGARVIDLTSGGTKAIDASVSLEQRIRQLKSDPNVAAVVPNYRRYLFSGIPETRLQPAQWALNNPHAPKYDIGWRKAADRIAHITPVTIGVVDQGLVTTDARLSTLAWTNPGETPGNGIDDDGNGFVDDVHGYNLVNMSPSLFDPAVTDNHGSFVSSIIAGRATGGADDVVGIAPNATIITGVVINDEGWASDVDILRGIAYVAMSGAKVINLSLGGYATPDELAQYHTAHARFFDLLERRGIILVCAAGNDYRDNDWMPSVPANLPRPNVISVCAIDADGALARYKSEDGLWRPYSNYGRTTVHIGAPGSLMLGIPAAGRQKLEDGTSFAAPVVTATLALVWGQHPTWDYRTVIRAVLETARPSPYLKDRCTTGGIIDIDAALKWTPPSE